MKKSLNIDLFFLLMAVVVLPLVHWDGSSNTYGQIKLYYLAAISGIYIIFKVRTLIFEDWSIRLTPLTQLLIIFLLLAFISTFWSVNQSHTIKASLLFSSMLLVYLVGSQVEINWSVFSAAIQVSGLAVSCLGITQTFWPYFRYGEDIYYPISTLGNPNFTAEYLLPVLMLTIVNLMESAGRKRKVFDVICTAIFLFALFLCRSSASLIAFSIGIAFIFILWRKNKLIHYSSEKKFSLLLGVVFLLFLMIAAVLFTPYGRRNLANFSFESKNTRFRYYAYGSTMNMALDNFWLGVGFKNFQFIYPRYRHQKDFDMSGALIMAKNTHNEYLQWAAETGIIGLISEVCLIVLLVMLIKESCEKGTTSGQSSVYRNWGMAGGIIVILIQALFSFNLRNPASGSLFFFFLGQLTLKTEKTGYIVRNPITTCHYSIKTTFFAVLILIVGAAMFYNGKLMLADHHLRKGILRTEAIKGTGVKAALAGLKEYKTAYELNPTSIDIAYRYANALMEKKQTDKAIGIFEKSEKISPYNIPLINNQGIAYGMQGDWVKAENTLKRVIALDENNLEALTNLTTLYQKNARIDEAIKMQKRVLQLNPQIKLVYFNLGALYEEAGLLENAINVWENYLNMDFSKPDRARIEVHVRELQAKIKINQ